MAEPRPFRPRDLLREVLVQELAVSADGETVVYARRTIEGGRYRTRLWRVPWRGGRPEQLTGGGHDSRPRFSPDGRTLLFLSDRSGSPQPWLLPLGGGEPTLLAELSGGVSAAEWSPDGARVLLLGPSGEQRFIVGDPASPMARRIDSLGWRIDGSGVRDQWTSAWLVAAAGSRPERLTAAGYEVFAAFWLGVGHIGVLADPRPEAALWEQAQAWSLPARPGARLRPLAAVAGEFLAAAVSAGGTAALLGIDRPNPVGFDNVGVFVVEGGKVRRLATGLDRTFAPLTCSDLVDVGPIAAPPLAWLDERSLVALSSDRGTQLPWRLDLDGGAEPLVAGDLVCSHLAVGGGRVVVVVNEPGAAGDVYAVDDGRLRRLSRNGGRWLAPYRRIPERVSVRRGRGPELDAWLLRGRGARRRRLVLQIHGGPTLQHGSAPWLEMLALASAGFSVLYGNPRGSAGRGEAFLRAIEGSWGDADDTDLMRLVDWAVDERLAERDRVALLGLSYGGYATCRLLGRFPGRFRAAVSENPVVDLVAQFATEDFGFALLPSVTGTRLPSDDPARVAERSPSMLLHRNKAPLLLLQAEHDLRCPPVNSDFAFAVHRLQGRTVEYVRYPDESHLLMFTGRPDRRVDRLERIVSWFEQYL